MDRSISSRVRSRKTVGMFTETVGGVTEMVICRRYERLAALCEAHARNLLCGARAQPILPRNARSARSAGSLTARSSQAAGTNGALF